MTWDDLSPAEVADRCLEVTVFDHDRLGQHDQIGGVRLNLGTGKETVTTTAGGYNGQKGHKDKQTVIPTCNGHTELQGSPLPWV